jgi:hypothetical protein
MRRPARIWLMGWSVGIGLRFPEPVTGSGARSAAGGPVIETASPERRSPDRLKRDA